MLIPRKLLMIASASLGLLAASHLVTTPDADAFCGTFVAGGNVDLYNDATQVALMRQGTKTVLSMQNNYKGPVKDFAMVVPVPVVLMEEQVKVLSPELFKKMDQLSAPRLVEYWESDPCQPPYQYDDAAGGWADMGSASWDMGGTGEEPPPVVIEAEFEVGEYDVVVLSASQGAALESWLTENNYAIPAGASPIFQQYIQNDMYFFVAKIDPAKVTFDQGEAVLSPLRFAYDSPQFSLPVRLGMINSSGEQDLIIYILSQDGRYELANYPNALIPTNKIVSTDTASNFGEFYSLLFEDTLAKNPGAVVTEYGWDASWCDPCPGEALSAEDFATLGADEFGPLTGASPYAYGWTMTRLHARYGTDDISEDLVFKAAPAIRGGRGTPDAEGKIDDAVGPASYTSEFQGRYIMLHWWDEPFECENPERGVWGYGSSSLGAAVSPNSGGVSKPAGSFSLDDFIPAKPFAPGEEGKTPGGGSNEEPAGGGAVGGEPEEVSGGGCQVTRAGKGATKTGSPWELLLGVSSLAGLLARRRRRRLTRRG